ncbi:hypothetical protein Q5752_004748 [Cryptotrichosporon argae]
MRQKRAKTYKRVMALYTSAFEFRQPFQLLVSNDLLMEASTKEFDIAKQLATCCQAEIKPMITQCCVEALYKLGKDAQRVVDVAKRFERRRCNHRTAVEPDECLKDVVGPTNKHRYVVAAQSLALAAHLGRIPGVPVVHFNRSGVLVLSPPSTATVRHKNGVEEARRIEGAKVLAGVVDGDNVLGAAAAGTSASGSASASGAARARKVKGPNPLSVKKKKSAPAPAPVEGKKRARDDEDGEGGREGAGEGAGQQEGAVGEAGPADAGAASAGRRKKRKRGKGKGAVATAIAEINAEHAGRAEAAAPSGGESDAESY